MTIENNLNPRNGTDSPINSIMGHVCRIFYFFPNQTLLQHHIAKNGIITGCLDTVEFGKVEITFIEWGRI